MAKNLFDSLSPAAAFAGKLFAAAGLDFAAMFAAGDEAALKAHLDSLTAGDGAKEAIEQATAKLSADLAERDTQLSALSSQLSAFSAAVSAAGVKFAADAKPEAITAAITARVSTQAAELLAKQGVTAFPEQQVSADPAKAAKETATGVKALTGLAKVQAAFAAQLAGASQKN